MNGEERFHAPCSEQLTELSGNGCFKLHAFTRNGMIEAQHTSMQAKTMNGVVAVTILRIAADRMSHIGRVNANLILAARLKLIFYQRMLGRAIEHVKMGDSIFPTVVNGR